MRSTYQADACKKENSSQCEIDNDLFYVAGARASIHKVDSAQYQARYAQECKYYADDAFFHDVVLGNGCKRYARSGFIVSTTNNKL
jgi:hypothetical protein